MALYKIFYYKRDLKLKKRISILLLVFIAFHVFAEPIELSFKMDDGTYEKRQIDSSDDTYVFVWTKFPLHKQITEISGFEKCKNLKTMNFYFPNYNGNWNFLASVPNLTVFGADIRSPSLNFLENLENLEEAEIAVHVNKKYYETLKNTKVDLKKLKKLKKICLSILFDNEENKDYRLDFIPPFINVQNKPELLIYDNRIEKISKEELRLLKQYSKVHLDFNPIAKNEAELAKLRKAKINFSAAPSF